MYKPKKPREIIDRKHLIGEMDALVAEAGGYSSKVRQTVLARFKQALADGEAEVRRRFEDEGASGTEVVRANAYLIDQLIRVIHDFCLVHVYPVANRSTGEVLGVVAVGGYGRGELAPQSDIDLLFLLPYKQTPHGEQMVEYMLYMLWDLGLKVGHSTRSIDDCIRLSKEDLTIRTALLDARWLWGDKKIFEEFEARFRSDVIEGTGPTFVDAKLSERDGRHGRMGDTRYVLEPNIKEGKGGLRDLQTLFWLIKYLYGVDDVAALVERGILTERDQRSFDKAQNFLWTVRCHLHYLAGRPEERLTFDVQTQIADRMGYTDRTQLKGVERFMKHYFLMAKEVGDLTRILCALLEEQHKKRKPLFRLPSFSLRKRDVAVPGFRIDGGRLTVTSPEVFQADPVNLIRLFHVAQQEGLDIHPEALRHVQENLKLINRELRADPEANRLFMALMMDAEDPELALRRLNEAGVFGRFVTEFGRIVAQMQYDMYHKYTVDEHTIRAVGLLRRIEKGELANDHPVATQVIHEVQSRRVLYLAVLLHDVAKGRGGDHSEIGAKLAKRLCPRLGLSEEETDQVSWLVLRHLDMSRIAFKRDIDDPKTIVDFVKMVQSPERLRLLLVLTVVDIRAVGPGVWNNWKAGLLRELYYASMESMTGGLPEGRRAARVERAKDKARARLIDWPEADVEHYITLGYTDYWLTFDADTHAHHARLIRKAEAEKLALHIETRVDPERSATEIIIYTADHPGLFSKIAGAMALGSASIVDARIATLANGMALDTFWVQDANGEPIQEQEQLKRLWGRIEQALQGKIYLTRELEKARNNLLPSRTRVFKVPTRVFIDNGASNSHTVIEVNGRDRLGLLYEITAELTNLGLQIASARISTYGLRVVDVFYVKDVFGLKVQHDEKLVQIRDRLIAIVDGGEAEDQSATAKAKKSPPKTRAAK